MNGRAVDGDAERPPFSPLDSSTHVFVSSPPLFRAYFSPDDARASFRETH